MPAAAPSGGNEHWHGSAVSWEEKWFSSKMFFPRMSCPEKFSHNRKHTHTQPGRGQWTSSHSVPTRVIQQAAEVCEVPSGLPRCSCPSFSPFQRAVCAVVPIWAWSRFRDSTLPVELWGTKVCCNVFTLPVGSFVLLSLNDPIPTLRMDDITALHGMQAVHSAASLIACLALLSLQFDSGRYEHTKLGCDM